MKATSTNPLFGFRAMPVEVYVSSIFHWDRKAAESRSIEIDERGFITADIETSTGKERTIRLGRVPAHLAFTFVPRTLAAWSGYVVGEPDAIREIDAISEPLEVAQRSEMSAESNYDKAITVPGLLVGINPKSLPKRQPGRVAKGGRR